MTFHLKSLRQALKFKFKMVCSTGSESFVGEKDIMQDFPLPEKAL